jgi:hypothetical protein
MVKGRSMERAAHRVASVMSVRMAATGDCTITDLAELFTVSRATVYLTSQRAPAADRAR